MKQFDERGAQLLGLSCDTHHALRVWAAALGGIGYPLLSDHCPQGKTAQGLGILNAEGGYPARSVTVIDPQGIVRAFHTYPPGQLPVPGEVLAELVSLQGK
ncbi:MAG: redoxin domain-containing protein [Alphaproteobacteria bacterium]|nr:redoxin domain-containing protein [Alphaproteobacteria bacterium]